MNRTIYAAKLTGARKSLVASGKRIDKILKIEGAEKLDPQVSASLAEDLKSLVQLESIADYMEKVADRLEDMSKKKASSSTSTSAKKS